MADSPFGPRKLRGGPATAGGPPPPAPASSNPKTGAVPPRENTWRKAAPIRRAATSEEKSKAALVVQAFARARLGNATVVRPRQVLQCAVVIQDEWRDYLHRTRYNRNALRQRRAAQRRLLEAQVDDLIGLTRAAGRRIVSEEADSRRRLWGFHMARLFAAVDAAEARQRQAIAADEDSAFTEHVRSACPPAIIPGTVENAELTDRNRILRLWLTEWGMLWQRHVAMCAREARWRQAVGREAILADEALARRELVQLKVVDGAAARTVEVAGNEGRLRELYELQREDYVAALARQRVATVRMLLVAAAALPESEPYQRRALDAAEARDRSALRARHVDDRLRLQTRELLDDEGGERRALRRQEATARGRIHAAVVGVQLMLIQRDSFDDLGCEFGSRTAIRWAEQRERDALVRRLMAGIAGIVVPSEEAASRLAIVRAERDAYARLLQIAPSRQVVEAAELAGRRQLFRSWVAWLEDALFTKARVDVMAAEEQRRRHLLQLFELEEALAAATEYLWLAEADERRTLARALVRVHRVHAERHGSAAEMRALADVSAVAASLPRAGRRPHTAGYDSRVHLPSATLPRHVDSFP